jgi:hypothetical protein
MWIVIGLIAAAAGIIMWRWYVRPEQRTQYNEFGKPTASATTAGMIGPEPGQTGMGGGIDAGGCGGDGGGD